MTNRNRATCDAPRSRVPSPPSRNRRRSKGRGKPRGRPPCESGDPYSAPSHMKQLISRRWGNHFVQTQPFGVMDPRFRFRRDDGSWWSGRGRLRVAGFVRQHARIDPDLAQGAGIFFFDIAAEDQVGIGIAMQPTIVLDFALEL